MAPECAKGPSTERAGASTGPARTEARPEGDAIGPEWATKRWVKLAAMWSWQQVRVQRGLLPTFLSYRLGGSLVSGPGNIIIPAPATSEPRSNMKVRCPRKGCNYYATAAAAEDAMVDLQDHLREVHGIEETPDRVKENVEGAIKTQSRSRS